jgi:conjugative transfer signal peptidase TraF
MPEPRDLPLFRWGEELRRVRLARRSERRRAIAGLIAAAAVGALMVTLISPPGPLLVWNLSESSPPGLYQVISAGQVRPGEMVIARPPGWARRLAGRRGYLPVAVPLVKRVGAAAGDRVCAIGEALFVNGDLAARRRRQDGRGRMLPWWTGCRTLARGEVLLLMAGTGESFDGRYFGLTPAGDIVGRARLIWAL